MTTHPDWDTSLSGVDPFTHSRSVLVVPAPGVRTDHAALDELRRRGWVVTVAGSDAELGWLMAMGRRHDVALICDIRGTRVARRALTAHLPTVALVPMRRRRRVTTLLREAGVGRGTTVLVVRDPQDAKILRRLCGSALVRLGAVAGPRDRAAALGAVLLRAHAWHEVSARDAGHGEIAVV